ncbi:MAG: hypothetical protein AAGG01_04035 [Planctomycetota bacterium]
MSWREHASEEAQADLDELVGIALERAETALEENGALWPFSVGVKKDGTKAVGMVPDSIDTAEHVERLERALKKARDDYRAIALVKDVQLRGQDADAIWVDLCHSEGPSMTCYLPYSIVRKKVVVGEMGAQACDNHFW